VGQQKPSNTELSREAYLDTPFDLNILIPGERKISKALVSTDVENMHELDGAEKKILTHLLISRESILGSRL
jgi:hypothetical protein